MNSTTLEEDMNCLMTMAQQLTCEERKSPVTQITTIAQLRVVALAIACQLRAIAEANDRREALKGAK